MKEQENTILLRQAYQGLKARDVQSFLALYTEDVQWQVPETDTVPYARKRTGRETLRQFLNEIFKAEDVIELEPQEFIAHGSKVIVLGNFSGRNKVTSKTFALEWVHIYTFRDGRVISFHEYMDTAAPPG